MAIKGEKGTKVANAVKVTRGFEIADGLKIAHEHDLIMLYWTDTSYIVKLVTQGLECVSCTGKNTYKAEKLY